MERQLKQKLLMVLLHGILGFIKKEVKPAQTVLHPFLLGLVALLTGRCHLVNISSAPSTFLRSKEYLHVKYLSLFLKGKTR